jgi:hypothetical protein
MLPSHVDGTNARRSGTVVRRSVAGPTHMPEIAKVYVLGATSIVLVGISRCIGRGWHFAQGALVAR